MIQFADNYYDINIDDIINELKKQLELEHIFLLSKTKILADDIMVSCPFHKDGQEKKPSAGIRKSDGFFHCFTCGESMPLEQFVSRCFGFVDFGQYGTKWLYKNFFGNINNNRDIKIDVNRNTPTTVSYITEAELDTYRYYHPYMYQRKLTDKVIDIFDIGYDRKTNCITFPVRDVNGNCLFVARRSVVKKFFNYPSNIEKPVYGLYEILKLQKIPDEIYICESMINALTLWTYGLYAVALNGTGTKFQYEQLKTIPTRKYILALDPDKAGREGMNKLWRALKNYKLITFLHGIPEGKDINDLTEDEFDKCYEIF